jgi:hypothetical protein
MPAYQVRVEEVPSSRAQQGGLGAPAWTPVPAVTPMGYGGGFSNAKGGGPKVLRPQDPPAAIPGGPLNYEAQGSIQYDLAEGSVYGGGLSYIVANVPQAFQWKQRQEVDPGLLSASPGYSSTPQAFRRPSHIGGRAVTASPFIVQRWSVYGSGQ